MVLSKLVINPVLPSKSSAYVGRRNAMDQCKKYMKAHHAIFDLDGVILDNHEVLDKAYKAVFEKYGVYYTHEWRLKVMGMTGKGMWRKVIDEVKLKTDWKKMHEYYREVVKGSLADAPLKPGIDRILDHFEKHSIPMAAVTSSTKATMEIKTSHIASIMSKFSHVVCAGDDETIKKSKPSGQIYLVAALRFLGRPEPDNCIAFEDTPNGVMAASCACMQVIGVPSSIIDIASIAFANETVKTLNDFWPGKYGMPPFPEQIGGTPPPSRF